jgi:ribonuclease HII
MFQEQLGFEIPAAPPKHSQHNKMKFLRTLVCGWSYEDMAREQEGAVRIVGIDECGRGTLFGSVCAGICCLPRDVCFEGLKDSKQLTAKQRERLDKQIREDAIAFAIGEVDAATIDDTDIAYASRLAMMRALEKLDPPPDHLLIDSVRLRSPVRQYVIEHGDALSMSIAAASVIAKVYRDRQMVELDAKYPGYGIAKHKGYGTAEHLEALKRLGPTPLHRMSFGPLRT